MSSNNNEIRGNDSLAQNDGVDPPSNDDISLNTSTNINSTQNGDLISRLRSQVQTLKDVSAIKQNLITLREREAKNLINKLKFFEEAVQNEKTLRAQLNERVEDAELQCTELTERLRANIANLADVKCEYENKIVELIAELETANVEGSKAKERASQLEKRIGSLLEVSVLDTKKNDPGTEIQEQDTTEVADKPISIDVQDIVQDLQTQLKGEKEKNRVLSYQMTLLNTLFMETEETNIDFERIRAIGDIVRESIELTKVSAGASSNSNTGTDDDNETVIETMLETDTNSRYLNVNDGQDGSSCGEGSRKTSFDINGLIEKLDASNEKKMDEIPGEESCYKTMDTTAGPKLVLSVSRTFIKLKDLILEKKSLQKEIDGLKELNDKLSVKVDQQERRLYCVTGELNKTWSLVATLKQQHKQLHNSKAVLRYELQEKRKLLEKLKRDLSLSREKWIRVRQKNSESEIEWLKIREEFTRRRQELVPSVSLQSAESGAYSLEEDDEEGQLQHSTSPSTISNEEVDPDEGNDEAEAEEDILIEPSSTTSRIPTITNISKTPKTLKEILTQQQKENQLLQKEMQNVNDELTNCDPELEGACGPDFDDPLDELEEIAEEIKTIEAAAAETSDEDNEDDDENDEAESAGIFAGDELNWERLVNRRAARLQVLEEQCRLLYNKLSASKVKSVTLATKLANLHNYYGSDSDDYTGTTDQSRPTEPSSSDLANPSSDGQGNSNHQNQMHRRRIKFGHVDNNNDLTEIPSSEMESQDEQFEQEPLFLATPAPTTSSSLSTEQPINSNESKPLSHNLSPSPAHHHHNDANHLVVAEVVVIAQEQKIRSEEDDDEVAVGQSTVAVATTSTDSDINDDNQDRNRNISIGSLTTTTREHATIIVTDEQIATRQNNLVVRDVEAGTTTTAQASTTPSLPTSQNHNQMNPHSHIITNSDESYQNLASNIIATTNQNNRRIENDHNSSRGDESINSLTFDPSTTTELTNNATEPSTTTSVESSRVTSSSFTNTTELDEEDAAEDAEDEIEDDVGGDYSTNPSDLSSLGRLIIQQLPKRLDILKHENNNLVEELLLSDKILKKTEEELANEKQLSALLQLQIEQQNLIEGKLHEELELQQQIIDGLKHEIGNDKISSENLISEKQKFSNFMQIYSEHKLIQDQRLANVKSSSSNSRKNCSTCHSKFTLFKRKHNCQICGHDFCSKCSRDESVVGTGGKTCKTCYERVEKLENLRMELAA